MHGRFPYQKLDTYPHMGPHDAELWEKHIVMYPGAYETVSYDVWVGEGVFSDEEVEDNPYKKNLADLTKFRIDVVGIEKDGSLDAIELRPRAGLAALGSVLGAAHFIGAMHPDVRVRPKIITNTAQSDMQEVCLAHEVDLVELDAL